MSPMKLSMLSALLSSMLFSISGAAHANTSDSSPWAITIYVAYTEGTWFRACSSILSGSEVGFHLDYLGKVVVDVGIRKLSDKLNISPSHKTDDDDGFADTIVNVPDTKQTMLVRYLADRYAVAMSMPDGSAVGLRDGKQFVISAFCDKCVLTKSSS